MGINWKSKLTSRKFWVSVVGFVSAILVACNVDNLAVEQVVAVITAGGVLIAYILGESTVDAARISADNKQSKEFDGVDVSDFYGK